MTIDEKQKISLAECLACLRVILGHETKSLNSAKWLAACAVAAVTTISSEGRVPTVEEQKEWVKRQGWSFLN